MSNIRYKLTTQKGTTHNGFVIPLNGIWFSAGDTESPPEPCTNTVLHHYADPRLAVLFNTIHADIRNPRLFEIEIDSEIGTDSLKGWCRRQRVIRELPLLEITTEQRVAFAIYCVEAAGENSPEWMEWARTWMTGKDRSERAAWARAARARGAAWAAWAAREAEARAEAWAARAAWAWAARAATPLDFVAVIDRVLAV